ncbi:MULTISPECIES: LysR family transcriptional regulator [unclassified Pseudomonas]|uniref:LysR family transcriptional regulator n=1 Tax=unclassified Pseudomonas TaxID=196821 RepID=UPI000D704B26|nr:MULTISPECIES: LysR family transcriptional regulator [unclassified Pseudomonas]PWU25739.1 nodulation protein NfeD [Pseudomonas sp. RW407]
MRFYGLDLNLLVVLDVLLTEQNITRAGERLHLSQPATSAALARLRDYFQDDLLVQIGRRMVRTPVGDGLTLPIRELLIQMRATLENRALFKPAESSRKFSLIVSDYVGTVLMPEVSRRINQSAPLCSIEMFPPHNAPTEQIERGEIDLLLLPDLQITTEHPSQALFQDEFVCVMCRDNPLTESTLSFEQYKQMKHVLVRWGEKRVPTVDEWFLHKFDIERRFDVITNTFNSVPSYLIGTERLATMHRLLAERWVTYLPLKILPLPWTAPRLTIAMQWNKYQQHDPGLTWLRSLIVEVAASI